MTEYFLLQYKMAIRKFSELGIHPLIGILSSVGLFILASEYLFLKTEFAKFIIILFSLSFLLNISKKNRNEFLKITFGDKIYKEIRIIENILAGLPFALILFYHRAYIEALIILILNPFLTIYSFNTGLNYTLPTPFYKKPFEFPVGFRHTLLVFPLTYLLTFIAIYVDNFNLGIFAMLVIFLVSLTYHVKPENEYFVWIFSFKPSQFLLEKLKTATFYSTLLALPIAISLAAFYPSRAFMVLLFMFIGLAFLWTMILAKYAAYPNEMNLPEGVFFAIAIYFPPFLMALLPYYFFKSVRKLNVLLK